MKRNISDQFIIITDPGLDDLLALLFLSKRAPKAQVHLIPSYGNASYENSLHNIKQFLDLSGLNWSYSIGAEVSSIKKNSTEIPYLYHGDDGVWGTQKKITKPFESSSPTFKHKQTIFSLAPLTSVEVLLKEKVPCKEIYIMGGVFFEEGNVSKFSEFNITTDVKASAQVLKSDHNCQIYLIPLDVSHQVYWTKKEVDSIPENTLLQKWIKSIFYEWYRHVDKHEYQFFPLHDPLTLYLRFFPNKAKWHESGVDVIEKGPKLGRTQFNYRKPMYKVAIHLNNPREIANELFNYLFL